jgi:L-ascorbate metabolism protein UlaG (beta-lactamase superfamily)
MDVRFLGHSCFSLSDGDATVVIDPFLTGNPKAASTRSTPPAWSAFKSDVESATSVSVVVLEPGETHST